MTTSDKVTSVFVEVLAKDHALSTKLSDKIDRGPFAGIFTRKNGDDVDKFLVIHKIDKETNKKALDIFNLKYYNIVTIEVRKEYKTQYTSLMNKERDQERAFAKMAEILAMFQDDNRVEEDKNFVNLGTYDTLDAGEVKGTHVNSSVYGASKKSVVYSTYRAPGRSVTTTTQKKEPTMTPIKRKRGCSAKALQRMFEMVQQIADKSYKEPEIPNAPKEDAPTTPKDDDDDDFYRFGYYG